MLSPKPQAQVTEPVTDEPTRQPGAVPPDEGALEDGVRDREASRRRLYFILPLVLFVALAIVLYVVLVDPEKKDIPSALIDKPVPTFDLPPIEGYDAGLATANLMIGQPVLVNIFASWCGPCRIEHPLLMDLATQNTVPIFGINYKDDPDDASGWLKRYGDPYTRIGADRDGRVGIDWGVYGVPETFVVDGAGRIIYKHIGVLTRRDLEETILPLIEANRG